MILGIQAVGDRPGEVTQNEALLRILSVLNLGRGQGLPLDSGESAAISLPQKRLAMALSNPDVRYIFSRPIWVRAHMTNWTLIS